MDPNADKREMPSLDQYVDRYIHYLLIEKGLSPKTIDSYSRDLTRYLDFLYQNSTGGISEDDTAVILKHLISLKKEGLSARSRARHLVTLRGFYRFLVEEKVIRIDPARLVDLPKSAFTLPDVLSVQEIAQMLNAPDMGKPSGVRDAAMIELLYAAGLRVSELIYVRMGDVNTEAGFVRVLGKGSKERVVPIGAFAKEKNDAYIRLARLHML